MEMGFHIYQLVLPPFSADITLRGKNGLERLKDFAESEGAKKIFFTPNKLSFRIVRGIGTYLGQSGRYKFTAYRIGSEETKIRIGFISEVFFHRTFLIFAFGIIVSLAVSEGFSAKLLLMAIFAILAGHLIFPYAKVRRWKQELAKL